MLMDLVASPKLYAYSGGKAFDSALPTVVFLHGGEHDHSVWALQSRYFAHHGYGVLALDLPGHMRSEGPLPQTIEAFADRIAAGLDACKAERLLLVGHSMGSLIALELATRLGEKIHGVAMLATTVPMRVSNALLDATKSAPAAAMDMINVWSHSASIDAFNRKPSSPGPGFCNVWGNLRLMQRVAQRNGAEVLQSDFIACNSYQRGLEAAAELLCPLLFILAQSDSMTPSRSAGKLIEACSDATVVTLPGAGHALMAENPDGVRDELVRFAARSFNRTTV